MEKKFDLRTKTYILYLVFISLQFLAIRDYLARFIFLYKLIYLVPLVLLVYNTKKSKKIAWSLSLLFCLIILFYSVSNIIGSTKNIFI